MTAPGRFALLVSALVFTAAIGPVKGYTLVEPDRLITIELSVRDVEKLARQIAEVFVANGFSKKDATRRLSLDMRELPPSASPDEGIILSRFEKTSVVSVFVQVTTCRATISMRLADQVKGAERQRQLGQAQEALVDGLSVRKDTQLNVTEGLGTRDNPCVTSARDARGK